MIEDGRSPAVGGVTAIALRTENPSVRVVLQVTGGTVHGRAFEHAILVTLLASDRNMFSVKMECECGMIHPRLLPAFGIVAGGAVRAELTVVPVILCVAREAILRCGFQVVEIACVNMALRAANLPVFGC